MHIFGFVYEDDKPLIVQFAAKCPQVLSKASAMVMEWVHYFFYVVKLFVT